MKLPKGIAEQKQQSNLHWGLIGIQAGYISAPHRAQSLTVLNRCGMLGFNDEYYMECFKSYDIYIKMQHEVFTAFSPCVVYQIT